MYRREYAETLRWDQRPQKIARFRVGIYKSCSSYKTERAIDLKLSPTIQERCVERQNSKNNFQTKCLVFAYIHGHIILVFLQSIVRNVAYPSFHAPFLHTLIMGMRLNLGEGNFAITLQWPTHIRCLTTTHFEANYYVFTFYCHTILCRRQRSSRDSEEIQALVALEVAIHKDGLPHIIVKWSLTMYTFPRIAMSTVGFWYLGWRTHQRTPRKSNFFVEYKLLTQYWPSPREVHAST